MMASLTVASSETESSLSSIPSNMTEYDQMLHDVQVRLQGYTSTGEDDHTVKLLSAFIECLPKDGVVNIAEDILNLSNDEGLCALAQHLFDAVLMPSRYLNLIYYVASY